MLWVVSCVVRVTRHKHGAERMVQRADDRGQKTEDRGQRADSIGQRVKGREQRAKSDGQGGGKGSIADFRLRIADWFCRAKELVKWR